MIQWRGAVYFLGICFHFVHFSERHPNDRVSASLLSKPRINLTLRFGCQPFSVRRCFSEYRKMQVRVDFAIWLYAENQRKIGAFNPYPLTSKLRTQRATSGQI